MKVSRKHLAFAAILAGFLAGYIPNAQAEWSWNPFDWFRSEEATQTQSTPQFTKPTREEPTLLMAPSKPLRATTTEKEVPLFLAPTQLRAPGDTTGSGQPLVSKTSLGFIPLGTNTIEVTKQIDSTDLSTNLIFTVSGLQYTDPIKPFGTYTLLLGDQLITFDEGTRQFTVMKPEFNDENGAIAIKKVIFDGVTGLAVDNPAGLSGDVNPAGNVQPPH